MAKKSKKSNVGPICSCLSIVLAVASIVLFMFLPMIKQSLSAGISFGGTALSSSSVTLWSGITMIFGGTLSGNGTYTGSISGETTFTSEIKEAGMNPVAFIAFLLIVIGIVLSILSFLLKKKLQKPFAVLGGLLVLAAGVLMFLVVNPAASQIYTAGGKEYNADGVNNIAKNLSLGYGAIIAGICGSLGGLLGIAAPLTK